MINSSFKIKTHIYFFIMCSRYCKLYCFYDGCNSVLQPNWLNNHTVANRKANHQYLIEAIIGGGGCFVTHVNTCCFWKIRLTAWLCASLRCLDTVKLNHCYSSCFCYCMRSWVVVWSLYVCDITVKTNIFLTLFGESGFNSDQGGNRKSNRQQGRHMKEKNKTERMSVRLVVSKHAWLWEETTNILTMLLTTTGAVTQTICDFISHGNVYTNKKIPVCLCTK